VNEELALLQDLGDSRRIASFKAVLARTKLKPRRMAPPLPQPLPKSLPQPIRRQARTELTDMIVERVLVAVVPR
jgi:hypothetical protein